MRSVRFEISPLIILKFPVWLLRRVGRWHWCLMGALAPRPEVDRASPPPGRQPGLGSLAPNLQQPLNRLMESPRRKQPQVSKPWPPNPQHPTWWSQTRVPPPHSRKFLISSPSKHVWIWFISSSTAHSNILDLTEEELIEELKKHGLFVLPASGLITNLMWCGTGPRIFFPTTWRP
jgi:hypothetical protein